VAVKPWPFGLCLVRKSKPGQRNPGETSTEFLHRPAAGYRLGHSFGEFIEFIVRNFPFGLLGFRFESRVEIFRELEFH
jgi:hypothetical protein